MSNIVIFGAPHSGKTTLLGYLSTAMLRHPQFNEEILQRLKLIKKMGMEDDFHIGDPYNPVHIRKDIILPSFVSLDRDELRKFTDKKESVPGGSKRLHHKQLTLCMSERKEMWSGQKKNENTSCTFIDLPGFRQRISDKYKGFFEGDIGLAVLDITEVLKLDNALKHGIDDTDSIELIDKQERKLFEPVRIWCDYRSSAHLAIVLSKIDQVPIHNGNGEDIYCQLDDIQRAVECIRDYTKTFGRKNVIPIIPISIRITQKDNNKRKPRMKVFFHREEENIYAEPEGKKLPGDGTLIACLKRLLEPYVKGEDRVFSMASVDRPMKAIVNYTKKTALQIRAVHGTLHNTDIVFLGPVLDKYTNEICYTRCMIASLKADGAKEPSSVLLEGNVGGAIFKSIVNVEGRASDQYVLSSVKSDSDIRILRSTILFANEVVWGDIVELEIYKKEYLTVSGELDVLYTNVLLSLMPYDEVILFWYGKKVLVKVVEIRFLEDKLCLSVILPNSQHNLVPHFALPCDKNNGVRHCDNVLLAISETNYLASTHSGEVIYTYISACINGIRKSEDYDAIWMEGDSNLRLSDILKGHLHFELERDSEREKVKIPIKSSSKKYSVEAALASISKNLKNNFNRAFYWRAGGVEMYLVKGDEKNRC